MKLELDIPESLVKKIKAYHALSGEDIEALVVSTLDKAVTGAIMEKMGGGLDAAPSAVNGHVLRQEKQRQDHSAVTDGLGDDDELFEEEEEEGGSITDEVEGGEVLHGAEDLVPDSGGLTEEALDRDMVVEDPENEAVAESTGSFADEISSGRNAEEMFAANLAGNEDEDSILDRRTIEGRRRRTGAVSRKTKVFAMTGEESSTF